MKKRIFLQFGTLVFAVFMFGTAAYAASDTTTAGKGKSSYTRIMGCSSSATFNYEINYNNGAYEAQLKDPFFWHEVRSEKLLSKGEKGEFTKRQGSKDAHWRGWVKSGKITVTI